MTDYVSSSCGYGAPTGKHRCPVNGKEYAAISTTTVKHHVQEPWKWEKWEQGYYFCSDPECSVVYFGDDDTVIDTSALRTPVGIKEQSGRALVCYCFGVTMNEAVRNPDAKAFVVQETKMQTCRCEIRNPSGRCCLKDFPKA